MYAKKIITIFADQICKQYASRDKKNKGSYTRWAEGSSGDADV